MNHLVQFLHFLLRTSLLPLLLLVCVRVSVRL